MYYRAVSRPKLFFKRGPVGRVVVERCSLLTRAYVPNLLLWGPHSQTILTALRQFTVRGRYYREMRGVHDGGCIALDWWNGSQLKTHAAATAPIVLVLHGLNGGSREGYVKWACNAADRRGWRAVVMNYRGCGGTPLVTPRSYSAVLTEDIHEEQRRTASGDEGGFPGHGAQECDGAVAASSGDANGEHPGTSSGEAAEVGGQVGPVPETAAAAAAPSLQHTGATTRDEAWPASGESMLSGAVTISNPFCMTSSSAKLQKPWTVAWLYNLALTFQLRSYIREHRHQVELLKEIDVHEVAAARTLHAFDTAATCKAAGYPNPEEYYAAGSSLRYIPQIRTPSLFIASEDDPLLGKLPVQECCASQCCVLAATRVGGHCAHLRGLWPLGVSWAEEAAMQFIEALRPVEGCSRPHASLQDEIHDVA